MELLIYWAKNNGVTKERQNMFQKERFDPFELIKLKSLNRQDLLALMVFCDIRAMNELPVVALTDDELRLAYVLWRAEGQKERNEKKRKAKKNIRKIKKFVKKQFLEGAYK